jgi:hypothetical protein
MALEGFQQLAQSTKLPNRWSGEATSMMSQ